MSRRINRLVISVELPENPEHQLEGSGHEVTARPISVVEFLSPAVFSRPFIAAELAESNQSWVFCQVNNKIKGERAKGVERNMQRSYYFNHGIRIGQRRT